MKRGNPGFLLMLTASAGTSVAAQSPAQSPTVPERLITPFTYSYRANLRGSKLNYTYKAVVSYDGKSLLYEKHQIPDTGPVTCIYDGKRTYTYTGASDGMKVGGMKVTDNLIVAPGLQYREFASIILPGISIPFVAFKAPSSAEQSPPPEQPLLPNEIRLLAPLPLSVSVDNTLRYMPANALLTKQGDSFLVRQVKTDVTGTLAANWTYGDWANVEGIRIARHLKIETYRVNSKGKKLELTIEATITGFRNTPLPSSRFNPASYVKANVNIQRGLDGKDAFVATRGGYRSIDAVLEERDRRVNQPEPGQGSKQ